MTISTEPAPLSYNGDDSTVNFPITWKYFAKSHVVATLRDAADAETLWVLGSDYTLTAAGVEAGGTLTATVAPATGETLVIELDPPNTQDKSLPLGGPFPSANVEDGLDVAAQRDSKLEALFDRCLRVPRTDTQTGSLLDLPIDSSRAGKFLAFDANGKPSFSSGTGADDGLRTDLASTTTSSEGGRLVGGKRTDTGAVAFTLHDFHENRPINVVTDFGAVGDGTTDDTAAFVAAFAAGNGMHVHAPGGRTYIVGDVVISGHTRTRFTCDGVLKAKTAATEIIKFDGSVSSSTDCIFDIVELDGNTKASHGLTFTLGGFNLFRIRRIHSCDRGFNVEIDGENGADNRLEFGRIGGNNTGIRIAGGSVAVHHAENWQFFGQFIANNTTVGFEKVSTTGTASFITVFASFDFNTADIIDEQAASRSLYILPFDADLISGAGIGSSTFIRYVGGAAQWFTYTPTVTADSGTFTSVSATGRFLRIGKIVHVQAEVTITTNGTAAGHVNVSLPSGPGNVRGNYVLAGVEAATNFALFGKVGSGAQNVDVFKYDGTYPGADGAILRISGSYEVV